MIDEVKKFYERDDISRICPGKRDVVSVKSNDGEKVKLQKRHLYSSLKERHAIFQAEHPEFRIGPAKFAMLRPPQVMLSSQTPSNVCTCVYHQNTILALDALHSHIADIPIYNKDFPASCLIAPDTDSCWYDECEHQNCGFECVYPFPDDDNLKEKYVKWFRWEDVNGRIIKNELSGTVHELYKYTETTVKSFLPHCFVKRKQEESYQSDKAEAQNSESTIMMLQMDYAENYSCSAQDEVQSAHWNQAQVTLYTSVSWFRDKNSFTCDHKRYTKSQQINCSSLYGHTTGGKA